MNNRMSVLSRRLGRFAACFSAITFSFLLLGLYANANNQSQTVLFAACLASVCFFASFFLWLAHGFAWAMIPEKTAGTKKPAESIAPAESGVPAEALRSAEAWKPIEGMRPAEAMKPIEGMRSAEAWKPIQSMKSAEAMKPIESKRPAEPVKPAEEKVIAPEDLANAKYTITGRRIL
jgi:hypothetical protein